ncbi:PRKR-interacting protein [Tasmannia lanceolata]|uniref:PRKR-interacting protein n=1 Tax=Tasmannia lanceolata TaxID=3420 RepID=UPI00406387BC
MSGGRSSKSGVMDRDLQIVTALVPKKSSYGRPPLPVAAPEISTAIVEYTQSKEEEEDIEVKLRRILEHIPVRVSNTSGSSAGSGSGDFHQYRQMRRKEQDRLARMDVDYQKRKELTEFNMRREERMKAAEERTARKRLKRQKKKQRKSQKKNQVGAPEENNQKEESSDDEDSDNGEELK